VKLKCFFCLVSEIIKTNGLCSMSDPINEILISSIILKKTKRYED
jgi:hypothetical protein